MSGTNVLETSDVAARELQAFLGAVQETLGKGLIEMAGELWLQNLERLKAIDLSEGFFRKITIRTVSEIARKTRPLSNGPDVQSLSRIGISRQEW